MPFPRKKSCGCNVCKYRNSPVDYRTRLKHENAYGTYDAKVHSEHVTSLSAPQEIAPQSSPEKMDLAGDLPLSQTVSEPRTDMTDSSFDVNSETDL